MEWEFFEVDVQHLKISIQGAPEFSVLIHEFNTEGDEVTEVVWNVGRRYKYSSPSLISLLKIIK